MKTSLTAIFLILICTLFTSAGQVFYKLASNSLSLDINSLLTNHYLFIGLASYLIGAVIMIFAFKKGELSVLYPFVSTGFIWVNLLAMRFLGESMSQSKWLGIFVIFSGISCIGFGSKIRNDSFFLCVGYPSCNKVPS
ncbi:MAG: EamA/RhaT family transporter [Candidatus Woesearchaeota archaeon]|nr:EamA/RhaT family transporter [Candidatus Woesearchaeota archaeon]